MSRANSMTTKKIMTMGLLFVGLFLLMEPTFAAATAGGGLPFDGWLTKIQNSMNFN